MTLPRSLMAAAVCAAVAGESPADFAYVYDGRTYVLVQAKRDWDQAQLYGISIGGELARINDAAENAAILLATSGRAAGSTAADGGGATYFWIGGRETTEGNYAWISATNQVTPFWSGGKNGAAVGGLFHNWGRGTVGSSGPEPDNFNTTQNRAAYALSAWPASGTEKIGQPGQWNDINAGNLLYHLIEVPAPGVNPSAPTNLQATTSGRGNFSLTWQDNATTESSFLLYVDDNAENVFFQIGTRDPNVTSAQFSNGQPHQEYRFLVRALFASGFADSNIGSVTTPDWITSRSHHPGTVGQPFSYQITSTAASPPVSFGATGLPPGLAIDPATGLINGVPTTGGVFVGEVSADLGATGQITQPLTVRVIHPPGPPIVTAPIPAQVWAVGSTPGTISLRDHFADPDTEAAVRFQTTRGSFDVALYLSATPLTTTNFLKYVDGTTAAGGDYDNSIVHRAPLDFVVQGGGFKPGPAPKLTAIPTDPSPLNEPGVSNVRGNIAMAKLGNDPNSATCQWFVNLADNSAGAPQLDTQNGGFTAFGRVLGTGMTVLDDIDTLPKANYNVQVDYPPPRGTLSGTFDNWPIDTPPPAPATLDQSKLVLVQSVTRVEPLSFVVSPISGPELALVIINNGEISFGPLGGVFGEATFRVTATDREGGSVTQDFTVSQRDTFSAWALRRNLTEPADALPDADPDFDALVNLLEFVLDGAPRTADAAAILPVAGSTGTTPDTAVTLTFTFRKFLTGHRLTVEGSDSLAGGSWAALWSDADGVAVPAVTASEDLGDTIRVTVRDPASPARRFLRLKAELLP